MQISKMSKPKVQLDAVYKNFDGQGQRSKFRVTVRKRR